MCKFHDLPKIPRNPFEYMGKTFIKIYLKKEIQNLLVNIKILF